MRKLRWPVGSMFLFVAFHALAQPSDPIAVAVLKTGDVAILDSRRGVFVLSGDKIAPRPVVTFPFVEAFDFTVAPSLEGDSFFISSTRPTGFTTLSELSRYTMNGHKTGGWSFHAIGQLGGIAVDGSQQIVYGSNSRLGVIYQLDLQRKNPAWVSLVKIRDFGTLGPIVFDAKRQRLLVADIDKRRVFSIGLLDKRVRVLL